MLLPRWSSPTSGANGGHSRLDPAGLAAIPMSAFCDQGADHADAWNHQLRFAFCKCDETLDEAIRRPSVLRD